MNHRELAEKLNLDGWATLEEIETEELLQLAAPLGDSVTMRRLEARTHEEAVRHSLSSRHGRGVFPPHTDGAAMTQPPKFVAMRSNAHYKAATLLFDGTDKALDLPLYSQSWLVEGGARSFYAVPRRRTGAEVHWRLNPDIMRPLSNGRDPGVVLSSFASISKIRIEWKPGLAVVWDNQRMLHSREAVTEDDGRRQLLRISVA